jgi:hypothetical protein
MKGPLLLFACLTLVVACAGQSADHSAAQIQTPCPEQSNAEMRQCFAAQQAQVTKRVDERVMAIASSLRDLALQSEADGRQQDARQLRSGATQILRSQATWKSYREQYCHSELSWAGGSGASTAYQECLFEVGRLRLQELSREFSESTHSSKR